MTTPQADLGANGGQEPVAAAACPDVRQAISLPKLIEKSVIIHKDENGFGLRIKGQAPVYIEHVHEGGAAWRAGVRAFDSICKVNGIPVNQMDHKDVVLMFKSCSRFVALTLISPEQLAPAASGRRALIEQADMISNLIRAHPRQYSVYSRHAVDYGRCSQQMMNADTTSLFATNDYALNTSSSSSFLMDRTRSCRSTSAHHHNHHHQHQHTQQQQQQLAGANSMDRQAPCSASMNSSGATKLNRRDSSEDKSTATGDKRIAICTCCQRQSTADAAACDQCNIPSGLEAQQAAHRHLIQRQPHAQAAGDDAAGDKCEQAPDKSRLAPSCSAIELARSTQVAGLHVLASGKAGEQQRWPVAKPKVINKRIEIIREFIDTERTHIERLRCLDELFYRPLKQANFMSPDELRMVFSCHRTLYKIHRQIYRILLSANFDIYSEPLIGSALLEIFEGDLKRRLERASCSFCSAQATNVELLNKLTRRDTKVGEFLAQVTSQRMIGRLGIKDLLASCFQRLTKYPLLLENMLKATPQILPLDDDDDDDDGKVDQDYETCDEVSRFGATRQPSEEAPASQGACERAQRLGASRHERQNSRRMLAISLAEEREFIERALGQSRSILVKVNDSIRVSMSRNKLKEIWKRTDKYPGVPLIDITKQQVVHEGLLTLRLSKRSFDVYVLLLNDYIIILTREGQDKYRLKFFTPEGKAAAAAAALSSTAGASSGLGGGGGGGSGQAAAGQSSASGAAPGVTLPSNLTPHQTVYSPVFVIDEHLTTRDAATDENGFYLLCKRKDDSRIYEFASRSPAERMKWRDKIQWTIERQMSRNGNANGNANNNDTTNRRPSCGSTLTKSSSDISANGLSGAAAADANSSIQANRRQDQPNQGARADHELSATTATITNQNDPDKTLSSGHQLASSAVSRASCEPTKIVGTISYVIDDGIVMPNKMESSRVFVNQAIQVNILDACNKPSRADASDKRASTTITTTTTTSS